MQSVIKKYIMMFAFLGFLILALFGLTITSTMTSEMGHIGATPCPYEVGQASLCPMNLFDNIKEWQSALQTTPTYNILLLLLGAFILTALFFNIQKAQKFKECFERYKIKHYERRRLSFYNPIFYNYLFSQGILNTKAY